MDKYIANNKDYFRPVENISTDILLEVFIPCKDCMRNHPDKKCSDSCRLYDIYLELKKRCDVNE